MGARGQGIQKSALSLKPKEKHISKKFRMEINVTYLKVNTILTKPNSGEESQIINY